jgi:heterotetrameric sarcosine oxidase gamma subunit
MVERVHPLAAIAAATTDCAEVQFTAAPPVARSIVRRATDLHMAFPDTCRSAVNGDRALLWLGPDEFLLLAADGTDQPSDAVDVSHRDTAIEVSGPRAAWVINAFCALDLHPSAFPVGMCTRTLLAKVQIVLWRTDINMFRIEVARSFAPYVWACLEEARREFLT